MIFEQAVNIVIKLEGGYVDNPDDPGGETRYGISKRSHPTEDIKNLTKGHAKYIYKRDYWNVVRCEGIAHIMRLPLFDAAVNHGTHRATLLLQETLGVTVDGDIGRETLTAGRQAHRDTVIEFMQRRAQFYIGLRTFGVFGKGWINRLIEVSVKNGHPWPDESSLIQ